MATTEETIALCMDALRPNGDPDARKALMNQMITDGKNPVIIAAVMNFVYGICDRNPSGYMPNRIPGD